MNYAKRTKLLDPPKMPTPGLESKMKSEIGNYHMNVARFSIKWAATKLLLLVPSMVFVVACGSSRPSDSQARKVVETHFRTLTQLGAKITDFRKLNGESKELEGQKIYTYRFLAAAELPAGIAWLNTTGSMVAYANRGGFVRDIGQKGSMWIGQFTPLPKGTTAISRGTITFRMTEKGWLSSDLPDTVDDGYCTDKGPADCYEKLGWNKLE